MRTTTRFRAGVAAIVIGTAIGGTAFGGEAVAASSTRPANVARVSGSADVRLTFSPDQDVRSFTFDAVSRPYSRPFPQAPSGLPTDATGTVRISHRVAETGETVRLSARVDCLATAPHTVTLTAVVTEADEPVRDWIGQRLGLSVYDSGDRRIPDRVGFSWAVVNGEQDENGDWQMASVGTCMGPAAFAPVTRGGYSVRHAELLPPPATAKSSSFGALPISPVATAGR